MFKKLLTRIGILKRSKNLNSTSNIKVKMQSPKGMRFFQNNMPDHQEGEMKLTDEELQNSVAQITTSIIANFASNDMNAEDGIYLGTAGVSYMFYHLSKIPALRKMQQNYIQNAIEYLRPSLQLASRYEKRTKHLPSFVLGNGGIYAVASAVFQAAGDNNSSAMYRDKYLRIAQICKSTFLECGDDELFVGRAGYLCGAIWLAKETNTPLALNDLYDICNAIVASGRNYSKQNDSKSPLMYAYYKKEYLGAAHGLSSILQMLLSVPGYLEAFPEEAIDIKGSVDYLLSLQNESGNFPATVCEIKHKTELVHWCHGAPGVVYLMARAYILWSEEKYLRSCEKCADLVWERGLLRKGPGICHGVAGNGYVFLLLYRLTNNAKHLHRAMSFAYFMNTPEFKQHARNPDNPFSLYEGIAGTACYLADLTQPKSSYFPFSNVF